MSLSLNGLGKKKKKKQEIKRNYNQSCNPALSRTISSRISALGFYPLKISRENILTQVKCLHMMEIKEDTTWKAHDLTFTIHPVLAAIYSTIQL